ncbi:MAG: hypothetical protein HY842_12095 [Bacteroidetes bacterium]|nr:hypothetical protein [Bacteroidota bacterium]
MHSLWHNRIFRENALVLLAFSVSVHLLYGKTVQAGFVTDFTGLMERLDGAPFRDFLHCFGFPALHQVTNFFLFLFVKCFGTNGLPWYLVFTSLHIANGFLGFLLAKKIFGKTGHDRPFAPALAASLLFLLSPYQADAVVWKVCFNFLFCTLLMFGSLLFLLKYSEQNRRRHLWWSHGLFVVALFTFELALALPLLAWVLIFLPLTPEGEPHLPLLRRIFLRGSPSGVRGVILPHVLLLAGYFLLNKLLLGGWVGHYGEGVHLNFDLRNLAANCLKYFSKYLLFWRDWPHGWKEALMQFFEKPAVAYGGLALGVLAVVATVVFFKKIQARFRAAALSWALFFLALAPVANLYVAWILQGENDRYGYLASLFFLIGLVALLQFFPRWLRCGLLAAWLLVSVFLLQKMSVNWQQSACIVNGLLRDFRWPDAPEVYVLAFPENYNGVPMFKDFSRKNLALKHALRYVGGQKPVGDFYQIAQINLTSPTDGLTANLDSVGVFRLQFKQWGNWWWLHGIGTGDYQTEQYRFRTDGNGCRVELKKPPKPGAVFIYSDGGRWRDLRFTNYD